MDRLARTMQDFLTRAVTQRLARESRVQPVLVGPPREALHSIYDLLTANSSKDWRVAVPSAERDVVVLLVDTANQERVTAGLSARCNWDYAIGIRNSVEVSLSLATPMTWDLRPESIANATETIGQARALSASGLLSMDPWPFLRDEIARHLGVMPDLVSWALAFVFDNARPLEASVRESVPWRVADELLGSSNPSDLVRLIGLPSLGGHSLEVSRLKEAADVLNGPYGLATQCEDLGLKGTLEALKEANQRLLAIDPANWKSVEQGLTQMFGHLRASAGDGIAFRRCPFLHFRTGLGSSTWWDELPYGKIRRLLDDSGVTVPAGRLRVLCRNALNNVGAAAGEPAVVADTVQLEVKDQSSVSPSTLTFCRRVGRQAATPLSQTSPGQLEDSSPPSHEQPLSYTAESPPLRPATIKVVSLASFACRGYARIRDASKNPPPRRVSGGFEQEITVARSGTHDLSVFGAVETAAIRVQGREGPAQEKAGRVATFIVDLEDGDEPTIVLLGQEGASVGSWSVRVSVDELREDAPRTRFEALVRAQREKGHPRTVFPADTPMRRIEQAYVSQPVSWRGLLAGWRRADSMVIKIDWDRGTLGDLVPPSGVRPPTARLVPPAEYLTARERVRDELEASGRNLGDVRLEEPGLAASIEAYLLAYIDLLGANPEVAAWMDCVAIHAPVKNVQAGEPTPTSEPVVVLLSPLHPLRLAWHVHAQQVLWEALETRRCPAAGLLGPHSSPSIMALPIFRGTKIEGWRPFVSVGCNEPHWALLWNSEYLRPSPEKATALAALETLGISPAGVTAGFTFSQVLRTLDEVAGILSTRAVLRIGLVGDGRESSACAEGFVQWGRQTFRAAEPGQPQGLPALCEVIDLRDEPSQPTAAQVAILSEETGERVRWFWKGPDGGVGPMDLVVLDQVGTLEPRIIPAESRAPIAPGALFRVNTRQDLGGGEVLQEARVARQDTSAPGLGGTVLRAVVAFEALSSAKTAASHLQFRPNQEAIGRRLDQASFVAATSSQIDPACFVRGAAGHSAYLWDYEIPGTMGVDEDRSGYYLIAKPTEGLKKAIDATARLVTPSPPAVDSLLDEISRRGIPVLKRMASGGGHSRGELGVLLAVRLLQDAFRDSPGDVRLPVFADGCLHLILPVDPYWEPLKEFRRVLDPNSSEERADLLVFNIRLDGGSARIKVTPVEVKFREGTQLSDAEVGYALRQAANLGKLLERLWTLPADNELWRVCSSALLAQCLDQAFRLYADTRVHGTTEKVWLETHELVLREVLGFRAEITVNRAGRLVAFDASPSSVLLDMDGDGRQDTVILCRPDAQRILAGEGDLSAPGGHAVSALDFSFPACSRTPESKDGTTPIQVEEPPAEAPVVSPTPTVDDATSVAQGEQVPSTPESSEVAVSDTAELTPAISPVPPELRRRVRGSFDGFIGNEPAVRRLANDLLRALIEKPPHLSKNYLLTGQPSTGKTELARRIAVALGLPFVRLDGRGVASRDRVFELVKGDLAQKGLPPSQVGHEMGLPVLEYPALIVFIDEVHLVPKPVQESLLTMLEAADRTVTLASETARMTKATFVFATTRPTDVDAAFRTRCTEIQLEEYDLGEVAEIVRTKVGKGWSRETFVEIARLGRRVPRVALEIARELDTEITVSEHPNRTVEEHLEEVRTTRQIDILGLMRLDAQYLELLEREGRPLGENAVLNMLGQVDRARVTEEIEPFLRRLEFIKHSPRGREITPEGKAYLLARRRGQAT